VTKSCSLMKLRTWPMAMQLGGEALAVGVGREEEEEEEEEEEGMGMEMVGGQPNVMRESLSGAEDALSLLAIPA